MASLDIKWGILHTWPWVLRLLKCNKVSSIFLASSVQCRNITYVYITGSLSLCETKDFIWTPSTPMQKFLTSFRTAFPWFSWPSMSISELWAMTFTERSKLMHNHFHTILSIQLTHWSQGLLRPSMMTFQPFMLLEPNSSLHWFHQYALCLTWMSDSVSMDYMKWHIDAEQSLSQGHSERIHSTMSHSEQGAW